MPRHRQRCECGLLIHPNDTVPHLNGNRHRQRMSTSTVAPARAAAAGVRGRQQPTTTRDGSGGGVGFNPVYALALATYASSFIAAREEDHDVLCEPCNKRVPSRRWEAHLRSAPHRRHEQFIAQQQELESATVDKNGIRVSAQVDFGIVGLMDDEGATYRRLLNITKPEAEARVLLLGTQFASAARGENLGFSAELIGDKQWIFPQGRNVSVSFRPAHIGQVEDTLELQFLDVRIRTRFTIVRKVRAVVGSTQDHEELRPKAPYVKPPPKPRQPRGRVVTLERPPTWTASKWVVRLLGYDIPGRVKEVVDDRNAMRIIRERFMPTAFITQTYAKYFQTLLWVEEDRQARDLDKYEMQDVELRPAHPRYKLDVPGLAEKRPSVLVGDYIQVRKPGTDIWYEGIVHAIMLNEVSLRFPNDFSTYRGNKFDVRFVLNRIPMRRMHQAVTYGQLQPRLLFPGLEHERPSFPPGISQTESIRPVNRIISGDEEQLTAIAAILYREPGSVPFVLFGPPGTGKTTTLVESIRQILMCDEKTKILACAPSNSAADIIAQRLSVLGPSQLFRLNSYTREFKHLPVDLQRFSKYNKDQVFEMPELETLRGFRVVVSTCITAGVAYGLGLPRGHFTNIFVDEAGQATEPEAVIAINSLAGPMTNLVLAGDPQQLGPVLHSPVSQALGLRTSLLSRIMARDLYDLDEQRGLNVVKLVKNWRSHAAILRFASEQFYGGELMPCADPVITESMLRSDVLVKARFPVVFHAVHGRDQREESSPSFFNIDEATVVRDYCAKLLENRSLQLKPEHVGVIAPYRAQCGKILQLISRHRLLQGIKVSSVEEFQGQERRVIILSTVRSNHDFIQYDIKHSLGFVANPRRFNVSITRAQALLIVVGDPIVLSLDPVWRAFMNYVHQNGGWRGKQPDWDTSAPVDGTQRFDEERREQANADVQSMIERIKSMIVSASDSNWEAPDGVYDEDAEHGDPAWRDDYQ